MADLSVTPVQGNKGITGNDVAITTGAAAVGALGGGAMYFKTPSEDAFVKSGLKINNAQYAEQAETLTAALKELSGEGTQLAEGTKESLKKLGLADDALNVDGIKGKLSETINKISDQKIFDKAKAAANDVLGEGKKFADDALKLAEKTTDETSLKGMYSAAKDNIKKATDQLDDAAKKGVEILKNAKMSAALKWGGIAAGALALLSAGYLYFSGGNNDSTEQNTEKA